MHMFNYYSRLPVCVSRQRRIKGQTSYAVLQNSWKDSHRSGKSSPSVTQVGQIGFNFQSSTPQPNRSKVFELQQSNQRYGESLGVKEVQKKAKQKYLT